MREHRGERPVHGRQQEHYRVAAVTRECFPAGPLRNLRELARYSLVAADAPVGIIADAYIDMFTWTIRYLCVNARESIDGRCVMISPIAAGEIDTRDRVIPIELTRDQIEGSPSFDGRATVARCFEEEFYGYYGWPPYWDAIGRVSAGGRKPHVEGRRAEGAETGEPGPRSCNAIRGSEVTVEDTAAASLEDFVVDTRYWVIRYLQVRYVRGGVEHRRLVSPGWIERLRWAPPRAGIDLPYLAISQSRSASDRSGLPGSPDYSL